MLHSTPCFYFVVFFFSFDLPDYCETFGCPMTDDCQCIPSYRIISFARIECMTKFRKKTNETFLLYTKYKLMLLFILSCTFSWHVFGFDMAFYCFVHNVVIVVDVFVFFYSLFILLFSDINPHLNTYDNAVYKIFPDVYVIVAYFACAALLFGNLTPIKRNISFEWI